MLSLLMSRVRRVALAAIDRARRGGAPARAAVLTATLAAGLVGCDRAPDRLLLPGTGERDTYYGGVGRMRRERVKKVGWAGQKATPQRRSRRRACPWWPPQARLNVATQRLVRSTLCLIRSSFSDEKRGRTTPFFL